MLVVPTSESNHWNPYDSFSMIEFEYLCQKIETFSIVVGLRCGRNWSEIRNSLASGFAFYKTTMSNDNFTALDQASKTLAKKSIWSITDTYSSLHSHTQTRTHTYSLIPGLICFADPDSGILMCLYKEQKNKLSSFPHSFVGRLHPSWLIPM